MGGDLSQSDHNLETFKYDHPLTPLVLLVSKTLEVQCPGCGDMKRMLVRHIKTDQACSARCSSIDLESFDRQLKRFRHRRQMKESKQRKREESEAVFSHMTEYKKRRREENKLEAKGLSSSRSQEETNYHYKSIENEEKYKNRSSVKNNTEMSGFQNRYPSKSSTERKGKDPNCDQENKLKRDLSDDFQSPTSKHKTKYGEEVHILTIGEFVKKEEHRSPTESEDGGKEGQEEEMDKETGDNSEATTDSRFSRPPAPTSLCLAPSVQNSLSPAQMVEDSGPSGYFQSCPNRCNEVPAGNR